LHGDPSQNRLNWQGAAGLQLARLASAATHRTRAQIAPGARAREFCGMSALQDQLDSVRATAARLRTEKKDLLDMGAGQLIGALGGATGAVVRKYLPKIVPGESGDAPAVWLTALLLDGAALATGSHELNYFATGYGGYLTGRSVEEILP
jgi:hypothetical protein